VCTRPPLSVGSVVSSLTVVIIVVVKLREPNEFSTAAVLYGVAAPLPPGFMVFYAWYRPVYRVPVRCFAVFVFVRNSSSGPSTVPARVQIPRRSVTGRRGEGIKNVPLIITRRRRVERILLPPPARIPVCVCVYTYVRTR